MNIELTMLTFSPSTSTTKCPISLVCLLNISAASIYLARSNGNSVEGSGIFNDKLVIAGPAIEARHDPVVIVAVNGEPVCNRL